jgi:DNA-binding transcriptional MerR regulator
MEVQYISIGDAAKRIDVPQPTLRFWVNTLEEYGIHFVKRTDSGKRIFEDTDIDIFKYMRDIRKEIGKRADGKDTAYYIRDTAKKMGLILRSYEDAPQPHPHTRKSRELLSQEDLKELLSSDRVKEFLSAAIDQRVNEQLEQNKNDILEQVHKENTEVEQKLDDIKKQLESRDQKLTQFMRELLDQRKKDQQQRETEAQTKKGFFSRLFGG